MFEVLINFLKIVLGNDNRDIVYEGFFMYKI